jgi:hypothetical protein
MARWLSFFSEYNFVVHYKPGKNNILADALSRRPDYDTTDSSVNSSKEECAACTADACAVAVRATSPLPDEIRIAYQSDDDCTALISHLTDPEKFPADKLHSKLRSQLHRYTMHDGLLYYAIDPSDSPRIVVPNDNDLRTRILYEFHDSPSSGHLGREKTFLAISRDFYWSHLYKWVRKYVRTCEICQRVKPSASTHAPLRSLGIPTDSWRSISMDFIFGLPPDKQLRTGILVFVDRFSKMVHLVPVKDSVSAQETAQLFVDTIFRLHGMPVEIVSDRDPRFTSIFWRSIFKLVGTNLSMSTAAHPETDGQTERVNRVLEDVLRSYATTFSSWSSFLPIAEFAINNSVHVSHGHTPFFVNYGRHPHVPALLDGVESTFSVGGTHDSNHESNSNSNSSDQLTDPSHSSSSQNSNSNSSSDQHVDRFNTHELRRSSRIAKNKRVDLLAMTEFQAHFDELPELSSSSKREKKSINDFLLQRQMLLRFVRDNLAAAVDRQKEQADKRGRRNTEVFKVNELVLLATANLPAHALSQMKTRKLLDRFIGPFRVLHRHGDAYTLDLPKAMRLHPTFYVGRLKRYHRSMEKELTPLVPSSTQRYDARATSELTSREAASPPSGVNTSLVSTYRCPQTSSRAALQPAVASHRASLDVQQHAKDQQTIDSVVRSTSQSMTGNSSPRFSRSRPGPPPLRDSHGQERWIVEAIVDHRDLAASSLRNLRDKHGQIDATRIHRIQTLHHLKRKAKMIRVYRVRWIGYSSDHDTWIPREQLEQDVPDVVREYDELSFSQQ